MSDDDQAALAEIAPPRKGRAALYIAIPVAVIVALLVAVLVTRKDFADKESTTRLQDRPAPAITGMTLDGDAFDLDQLRGTWVYVNFFASWCTPCLAEHDELLSFDQRHRQIGDAQLVSVVFADDTENVRRFFDKEGGDWPVVVGDNVGRISLDYGVTAPPETFLIDPAGIVRARFAFPIPTNTYLDQKLNQYAAELYGVEPEATGEGSEGAP